MPDATTIDAIMANSAKLDDLKTAVFWLTAAFVAMAFAFIVFTVVKIRERADLYRLMASVEASIAKNSEMIETGHAFLAVAKAHMTLADAAVANPVAESKA